MAVDVCGTGIYTLNVSKTAANNLVGDSKINLLHTHSANHHVWDSTVHTLWPIANLLRSQKREYRTLKTLINAALDKRNLQGYTFMSRYVCVRFALLLQIQTFLKAPPKICSQVYFLCMAFIYLTNFKMGFFDPIFLNALTKDYKNKTKWGERYKWDWQWFFNCLLSSSAVHESFLWHQCHTSEYKIISWY